jgi:hypothetical protein
VIWLSWRQQRIETALAAALLALACALLLPLGLHMASAYDSSGAAACVAHAAAGGAGCGGAVAGFLQRFEHAGPVVPWLNLLPGLFGVLFAAPLVLELEHGTFRFSWTQGVTRRRWLTVRLVAIAGSALLAACALTLLLTWWRQPLDHVQGRMDPNVFDFEGIVPYAYTLFAVALVVALGVFTRRTLVAIGGALVAFFALRLSIQTWVRAHYLAPLRAIWRPGTPGPADVDRAWSLVSRPSDAHGRAVAGADRIVAACMNGPRAQAGRCLTGHHVFNLAVYQPAGRFWLFQAIEAGIFAGLAALLVAAAVWWLRHRVG